MEHTLQYIFLSILSSVLGFPLHSFCCLFVCLIISVINVFIGFAEYREGMYSAFGKEDWIRTRWSKELSETWVAQFVVLLVVRGDSLQRNLKNETQIFNECYQWFNCFQMVGLIQRHFVRRFLCFFATCCLADQICNGTVVWQIITE